MEGETYQSNVMLLGRSGWVPLYLGVTQKLLQDLAGKGQPDSKSTWKRI